ncbi:hypothetical protein J7F03_19555 [Streptomyces sp. ISL-43]|uniref:hypothetical protein n=1 Tax=Streptomyces sp. ISL-43 TaxID=2819183 RepID=UPI001BE5D35C|nr:hypothetical protein [Streptomyces sp. ISL-43]MBT2449249.1 hypothetical protein [Streptomyces sp. ISL-43]
MCDAYGVPAETEPGTWRRRVCEVRHLGALRPERHRLSDPAGVKDSYRAVAEEPAALD